MKIEKDIRKKRETILLNKQVTFSKSFIKKATCENFESLEDLKNNLNKKAENILNIKLRKAELNQYDESGKRDSIKSFRNLLKKGNSKFLEDARNIEKE